VNRFAALHVALIVLVWSAAIYIFRADVMAHFLGRSDSHWERLAMVAGLLFIPVMLLSEIHVVLLGRTDQHGGMGFEDFTPDLRSLAGRAVVFLALPVLLLACGIVAWRDLERARGAEWLASASLVFAMAIGLFRWSNATALGKGGEVSGEWTTQNRLRDGKRRAWIRSRLLRLGVIILVPACTVAALRQARLEDTPRYLGFLGGLLLSAVLLFVIGKFVPDADIASEGGTSGKLRGPIRTFLGLAAVMILAFSVCALQQFSFDLTQGDEGWAMIALAGAAAVFALLLDRRRQPTQAARSVRSDEPAARS
jgi:hypothetical protein